MGYPTLTQPSFEITIPSTGKKALYRRFLTYEEKMLLMAKQSENLEEIARIVGQVIDSCLVKGTSIQELTPFDFDYVFLKLRAASVDNTIKIKITDEFDESEQSFTINLDDIEIDVPQKTTKTVDVGQGVKISLKYPTNNQLLNITNTLQENASSPDLDYTDLLIISCIDKVFNDEEEFTADSTEDTLRFVNSFPSTAYQEIKQFLDEMPELYHAIQYKNSKGEDKEVVLRGLYDFFTF